MGIQPQFRSPLVWDVFAVSTYFTISLLFWYVGLIPDLATMRDQARQRFARFAYGILAMGWRGSAIHWHRYEMAYLLLAGLATPLVVSVHTVVSFDFAVALVPGWHSTIFPPYFVAGAIYSGFAMVLTLAIPLRKLYGLEDFITLRHLKNMGEVMLATGLIVAYGYLMETFMAWYSGNIYEQYLMWNRMFGPYWYMYWALILFNILVPQALWFPRVRTNPSALFIIAICVNIGMWLERYVIVVVSLSRDFLPSSWGMYSATVWDYAIFVGTHRPLCVLAFSLYSGPADDLHLRDARTGTRYRGTEMTSAETEKSQPLAIYGLMAEFDGPEALLEAARRSFTEGYRRMDAYSPFPVDGLAEAIGFHKTRLPLLVLIGGIIGCAGGFYLQYWAAVIDYPLNIGGRPLNSWPMFIPVTFELTILVAGLTAVLGLLALNGLPMPYHPVFNVERFQLATRNRFFCVSNQPIQSSTMKRPGDFSKACGPQGVYEVER